MVLYLHFGFPADDHERADFLELEFLDNRDGLFEDGLDATNETPYLPILNHDRRVLIEIGVKLTLVHNEVLFPGLIGVLLVCMDCGLMCARHVILKKDVAKL